MGIQGLLPLLKDIQTPTHVKEYKGKTLGIDAYVWLHRGAFSCAQELALGQPTDKFIRYSINKINMLRHFGVTPYLVFDGGKLPSKAGTEDDREKRRAENRAKAEQCLEAGQTDQARDFFAKCVDITPEIAYQLIKALRRLKVSYIVAPYEADAQLAYLEQEGIIDGIITEDSDLLVFGCQRVLFKLESDGSCIEILQSRFTSNKAVSFVGWTIREFRQMSILSGCDYLDNINGLGLKNAHRLLRRYKTVDKVLQAVRLEGKFRVPPHYNRDFRRAELTFIHQRVIDPRTQVLTTISPIPDAVDEAAMDFIGPRIAPQLIVGIANGDLNPMTYEPVEDIMTTSSTTGEQGSKPGPASAFSTKAKQKGIASYFESASSRAAQATTFPKNGARSMLQGEGSMSQPGPSRPPRVLVEKDLNRPTDGTVSGQGQFRFQQMLKREHAFATQQVQSGGSSTKGKRKAEEVDVSGVEATSRFFALGHGDSPDARRPKPKASDEDIDACEVISSAAESSPLKAESNEGLKDVLRRTTHPTLANLGQFRLGVDPSWDCDDVSSRGSPSRQRRAAVQDVGGLQGDGEQTDEPWSSPSQRLSPRVVISRKRRSLIDVKTLRAFNCSHEDSPPSNVTSSPAASRTEDVGGWEEDGTPTARRTKDLGFNGSSTGSMEDLPHSQTSQEQQRAIDLADWDVNSVQSATPSLSFSQLDRRVSSQFGRDSPHESQLGDDWAAEVLIAASQGSEAAAKSSGSSPRDELHAVRRMHSSDFHESDDSDVAWARHGPSRVPLQAAARASTGSRQPLDEMGPGLAYRLKDDKAMNAPYAELGFTTQPAYPAPPQQHGMNPPAFKPLTRAVHREQGGLSLRSVGRSVRMQQQQQPPSRPNALSRFSFGHSAASEPKRARLSMESTQQVTPARVDSRAEELKTRTPLQALDFAHFRYTE
ncbi:hypothetical protein V8E36_008030 [Tilletia maclaganii]